MMYEVKEIDIRDVETHFDTKRFNPIEIETPSRSNFFPKKKRRINPYQV